MGSTSITMLGRALVASVALLAAGALALAAGQSHAAAKPGFVPGTWVGKGAIKGTVVDGPLSTHFDGGITFTLTVDKRLRVAGSGAWKLRMLGSEDGPFENAVDSSMQGSATLRLGGTSTGVRFSGLQHVAGEIRMGEIKRPISFDRPLNGSLVITRAGKCKVVGSTQVQAGVTLTWSARLKGAGRCNA